MNDRQKGILIFGGIALFFLIMAILAFLATDPVGTEERFAHATGQDDAGGDENENGGIFGFGIEGSIIGYFSIFFMLIAAAIFLWGRLKTPRNAR